MGSIRCPSLLRPLQASKLLLVNLQNKQRAIYYTIHHTTQLHCSAHGILINAARIVRLYVFVCINLKRPARLVGTMRGTFKKQCNAI